MNESELLKAVLYQSSRDGEVLFRNQVGKYRLEDGRYLSSGLCVGSSDLVGWTSKIVTPDMVGKTIAIIKVVECKSTNGRLTSAQLNFLRRVHEAGGDAWIARPNGNRIHFTRP